MPSQEGNRRSGQAVVELAITLPILLILLIGMINVGIMINAQIILTQAAWEGARAGATSNPVEEGGDAPIFGAVRGALGGLREPQAVKIDIEPAIEARDRGLPLTVSLEYPLRLSLPFSIDVLLRAQATSRIEYVKPP
jgi:hypothetical protein